eukprot:TRINITY_DN127_c0_g1_i4.p1 TRINITY_DN127_c0_g1~~TRINITY_DN127_c0_g1_i4.p1  ORF type:complete len:168 (-),score=58.15 TRINITY_DN127_c0_g1_i4:8-454(-)
MAHFPGSKAKVISKFMLMDDMNLILALTTLFPSDFLNCYFNSKPMKVIIRGRSYLVYWSYSEGGETIMAIGCYVRNIWKVRCFYVNINSAMVIDTDCLWQWYDHDRSMYSHYDNSLKSEFEVSYRVISMIRRLFSKSKYCDQSSWPLV